MTVPLDVPIIPPLFIQSGQYTAKGDRALVGALLIGSGGPSSPLRPMTGVRPQGLVQNPNQTAGAPPMVDSSLLVARSGSQLAIGAGAAFVPAEETEGLNGVYLVMVETPVTIAAPTFASNVWLIVHDPDEGAAEGQKSWEIKAIDQSGSPPSSSVLLAGVTVSGGVPSVSDKRNFTTGLGGTHVVASASDIIGINMPAGTLAYVRGEKTLYVRNPDAWTKFPAIVNAAAATLSTAPRLGELYWDSTNNTLYIGTTVVINGVSQLGWQPIGKVGTMVRTGYANGWTSAAKLAESCTAPATFWGLITQENTWHRINGAGMTDVTGASGGSQPENRQDVEVDGKVNTPQGHFAVTLSARCTVRDKADPWAVKADGKANIGIEISTVSDSEGTLHQADILKNGLQFVADKDGYKHRTAFFQLPYGEYIFRPVIMVEADCVVDIEDLGLDIAAC